MSKVQLTKEELLARWDKPAPRYTSYPPVPVWSDDYGHADHAARLREASQAGPDVPLAFYAHLPFCKEMCTYCGCNVVITKDRRKHVDYVETIRAEMDLAADLLGPRNLLNQLHFGGGTPTSLDEPLLLRLWQKIAERFRFEPGAELSIEADPVVTTREQVALLRGLGFSRISFGVQDFTPKVQQAVNRVQTVAETDALVSYARSLGFHVHLDLIYGLPFQTDETYGKTLDEIVRMAPARVAVFSYAHVPELRPHQKKIDAATLPKGDSKQALFLLARDKLTGAGYVQVGFDHFARPDDELAVALRERRVSRSFQGYTVRPAPDLIAFGSTGISDIAGSYAQNLRPLGSYAAEIKAGRLPVCKGFHLSADDRLRRDAITAVMCSMRLDLDWLGGVHGVDARTALAGTIAALAPLEADGLVEIGPKLIEVTEAGRPFLRNVAMTFDAHLSGPLPVQSRTV